jgi:hypothetical protein
LADAVQFGKIIINWTAGTASLDAVQQAGSEHFAGKILIDVANRLERTETGPTVLTGDNSLGEGLQHALPHTGVVKTLNTVNHQLIVNPDVEVRRGGDAPEAHPQCHVELGRAGCGDVAEIDDAGRGPAECGEQFAQLGRRRRIGTGEEDVVRFAEQ